MRNLLITLVLFITTSVIAYEADNFDNVLEQQLTYTDATSLTNHSSVKGVIVGMQIMNKSDQEKYFGGNLDDVVPIIIGISNKYHSRIKVNGSILVKSGNNLANELQLEEVHKRAKFLGYYEKASTLFSKIWSLGRSGGDADAAKHIRSAIHRTNLANKSFLGKILNPAESYFGVVFYDKDEFDRLGNDKHLTVAIQHTSRASVLTIDVGIKQ